MNTLSPSAALFLAHIERIQTRLAHANQEISSGKRINVASDEPDQIANLLQLRADLQRNTQIQANLVLATTDVTTADNTLSGASSLLDQAIRLGAQGANDTQTAGTRNAIALQVAAIQAQMVSYSQTQVLGRYIFSGDQDAATYQLKLLPPPDAAAPPEPPVDPAIVTGVESLSSAAATRQVEDPAGASFAAAKTAQEIFDSANADGTPAADNVFAALNSLRLALLTNNQSGIAKSIDSLHSASTHLNDMLAFYGTVANRIAAADKFASKLSIQLETEISQTEDADAPGAALELAQANIQLQAAFQMQGRMPTQTLFDFLA
jgi:flagellar hook-associated protein 3 FlgL